MKKFTAILVITAMLLTFAAIPAIAAPDCGICPSTCEKDFCDGYFVCSCPQDCDDGGYWDYCDGYACSDAFCVLISEASRCDGYPVLGSMINGEFRACSHNCFMPDSANIPGNNWDSYGHRSHQNGNQVCINAGNAVVAGITPCVNDNCIPAVYGFCGEFYDCEGCIWVECDGEWVDCEGYEPVCDCECVCEEPAPSPSPSANPQPSPQPSPEPEVEDEIIEDEIIEDVVEEDTPLADGPEETDEEDEVAEDDLVDDLTDEELPLAEFPDDDCCCDCDEEDIIEDSEVIDVIDEEVPLGDIPLGNVTLIWLIAGLGLSLAAVASALVLRKRENV
jgi:hypothetical protein